MTHALKTWPQYFKDIASGEKTFELRKDDRPFQVGDILLLQEWGGTESAGYTGKEETRIISYILRDASALGLKKDYCIIGFKGIDNYGG